MREQNFSAVTASVTNGYYNACKTPDYCYQTCKSVIAGRSIAPAQSLTTYRIEFGMLGEIYVITGIHHRQQQAAQPPQYP